MRQEVLIRCPENPVLVAGQCPYPAELVFNAGVVVRDGVYYMIFRNDWEYVSGAHFNHFQLGLATSLDGIHFDVYERPVFDVAELNDLEIKRMYDVRLMELEGRYFCTMAVDTRHGLRAGIAETEDFIHLHMISMSLPDNRNLVLFPEKIAGSYVRMERPFTLYNRQSHDIWLSRSPDLVHWGESELLLRHEDIPMQNSKIGPGTPPIRTPQGWLSVIHAVDLDESRGKNGYEPVWQKRYCAYALLQDLDNPCKILGISPEPVLMPKAAYETAGGFRNNVVFPMALIPIEEDRVRLYYGAADAVMAMAEGSIYDLVQCALSAPSDTQ